MKSRKGRFSWVFVIVAVLTVGFISFSRKLLGASFIENFASNWLATLLGVIIGVPVALWVSNLQENQAEKERKEKILKLLYRELKSNLENLRFYFDFDTGSFYLVYGYLLSSLNRELWRTFSNSGEIQWIKDLELLNSLSYAYHGIDHFIAMTKWVESVGPSNLALLSQEHNATWEQLLHANMEDTIDFIQEALKLIESHVEITDKAELTPTFQHG